MLKQNIIFVGNKPGSLKQITKILAEVDINIYGFACFDAPEFAVFRMVCEDPERAQEVLTERGYMSRLTDVIVVDLKDETGGLDELLAVFDETNVNLNYIYTSFHRKDQIPVVIVSSEELLTAESVLERRGFRVVHSLEELRK